MINSLCLTKSVSRSAGGLFASVRQLSQHLESDAGVNVRVVGLADAFSGVDVAEWAPISVETHRIVGPGFFAWAPGLVRALTSQPAEILHLHGLWTYTSVAASRWHNATGRPYMVSVHGMLDWWALRHSAWKKRLALACYESQDLKRAKVIRTLCAAETQAVRDLGLSNPIAEIPNGVEIPTVPAGRPFWENLVEPGGRVLLYLSRLHPKKRVEELVRAWAELERDGLAAREGWWLAIVGWDQAGYQARLEALVRDSKLRRVIFMGPKFGSDKDACFAHAAGFVLPSVSEGLPMVVLEAWASGIPALITDACNLPEGFGADAAIRITAEPEGIEAGIRRLVAMTDGERNAMGERGRTLVAQRYCWRQIAVDMRGVYEWMLGGGTPPDCLREG